MTTRHRYLTITSGLEGLCVETFGGAARCNLPYRSDWHYNDREHPFSPREGGHDECNWRLQEGTDGTLGLVCAADVDGEQHQLLDYDILAAGDEPVTMVLQYPQEEEPVQDWRQANITVPDEAGVRAEEPATEVLRMEASQYRWQEPRPESLGDWRTREGDLPPHPLPDEPAKYTAGGRKLNPDGSLPEDKGTTKPEDPEWAVAVGWLQAEDISLSYGPWPVRKFLLCDEVTGNPNDEEWAYREYVAALDKLGQDYNVSVYRQEGRAWRFALVTWAWAYGLNIETICDEFAAMYG